MRTINRREFLKGGAGGVAMGLAGLTILEQAALGQRAATSAKPNIVFILTDDQQYNAMSCAGHPFLKTPNIDRIRNEGALFSNAFVTTSLCSPARASYLTGTYAHTHGVMLNAINDYDAAKTPSFPQVLREKGGYATAFIGKWHLDSHNDMPRPGFDYWLSFMGQGVYFNPKLNENGRRFDETGYISDILSDYACKWIRKASAGDKPFCAYVSHKAVHSNFAPAPRHKGVYDDVEVPEPPSYGGDRADQPAWQRTISGRVWRTSVEFETPDTIEKGPWKPRWYHKQMMETVLAVDEGVGKILDTLEETGELDNTIVVFASDNGYFLGEHGRGDKRLAFEESLRVPLVMRYPKALKAGTTVDKMVLNIDIAPTMLALAGVEAPAVMQGRSFVPLLTGHTEGWRKSFLYEYWRDLTPGVPRMVAVRTDQWKYIRYPDIDDIDELYDLVNDPLEQINLSQKSEHAARVKQLRAELDRLMRETKYVEHPTLPKSTRPAGLVMALDCGKVSDGIVRDTSGNGNNARLSGEFEAVIEDEGRSALNFTGSEYLAVKGSDSLNPTFCPWTVEAWIKPAGDGVIAAHGGGNNNGGYIMLVENGIPSFGVHTSHALMLADARESCIGKWTHVVGVFRAHHADIYVDGKKIDSMRTLHELHRMPWGELTLGADTEPKISTHLPLGNFTGLIQSVRMYRQEMSDAEVGALYQQGQS